MKDLKDLRIERGEKVKEMRDLLDLAESEKRDLTADEESKYDAMHKDQEKIGAKILREERQADAERDAVQIAAEHHSENGDSSQRSEDKAELEVAGFRSFIVHGDVRGEGAEEYRALQAGSNTQGGYLMMPQKFVQSLIKAVDDEVFVRGLATVFQTEGAQSLGAPSLENDPADADWTTELGTGTADSTMSFGKRELMPHPMAKRIKVSNLLLQNGLISPEALVRMRLSYKFGITEEKAYLTGSGSAQPLGLFTASNAGISTSRDVSTGNSTTAIAFDGLYEAKFSLKGQYQKKAAWLFHRDAVKNISKLKDGDGRYIWEPSTKVGTPDSLLALPLNMSEYVPNTFTTGLYVGLVGDFSNYWIVDALNMQIQRLVELYAESNETGFIGRKEGDGMPVLEESFARVKLA